MAKMFFSLKETAKTLRVTEEQVAQMVVEGKLQQFRDRNKFFYKRDQVIALIGQQTELSNQPDKEEEVTAEMLMHELYECLGNVLCFPPCDMCEPGECDCGQQQRHEQSRSGAEEAIKAYHRYCKKNNIAVP